MTTALRSFVVGLACAVWLVGASPTDLSCRVVAGQEVKFDVNDVSYLWPVATTQADVDALISSDDKLADGVSRIWPQAAFDAVIKTAETVSVRDVGRHDGDNCLRRRRAPQPACLESRRVQGRPLRARLRSEA